MPARQTTACVFGGPGLRDFYITTAATGAPPPGRRPRRCVLRRPGRGRGPLLARVPLNAELS
ncbi:hypothetical protein [Actinoallomurus acanthiterrae]